jgi:hypothetical protein
MREFMRMVAVPVVLAIVASIVVVGPCAVGLEYWALQSRVADTCPDGTVKVEGRNHDGFQYVCWPVPPPAVCP